MSRFLLLNFEDFGLNQDITKTIQSHTLFCICCLERNVGFINITTCSHSDYLDNFTRPELKPINEVICHTCHNMLKKIKQFKLQVEQSFNLLTTQALDTESADIRKANFEVVNVVNINIPSENPNPSEADTNATVPPDKTPAPEPTPAKPVTEKQMKNIKEALKIIDNNTKNASVKLFTDSVKTLVEKEAAAITESVACFIKTEIPEPPVIVKIEGNTSVEEQEAQETPVSPNILNIRTVMITEEELKEERATIAASDAYRLMPHRCDKCLIGFNYKENLEDHNNRKHMAKKGCVVCDICEQILYPAGGYAAHKYRHFSRFECAKCCKRYHCYESAVDHYKLAHTEQVEKPSGRRRRPEYRLPRQDRDRSPHAPPTHTVVKRQRQHTAGGKKHLVYRCSICKQVLKNYENLQKHMQIKHFKNSGLECDLCGRKYTNRIYLKRHMAKHFAADK
ncbi:unnamed protein product [Chrysodeixis includens]|uniref:C2H2-type domain-containing protein n=1 Tax=Chrysodeixis includens TaxID=689277 RepID=A0A9P0FZF3_CHRIL|nr:unnamed protein product [Chrysodeixis includens]